MKSRLASRLGSFLLPRLVRLLGATCRREVLGEERLEHLRTAGEPAVLAAWHHELFLLTYFVHRDLARHGAGVSVLVSPSRDGDLGAAMAEQLGVRPIRGSSSRGGGAGLRRLLREVRSGRHVVLVPDGPRGPARQAKPGALAIADWLDVPIVPLGFAVSRSWRLRSWDGTLVPRPRARMVMKIAEPLVIPARSERDSGLARLTAALDSAEVAAASRLGIPPVPLALARRASGEGPHEPP